MNKNPETLACRKEKENVVGIFVHMRKIKRKQKENEIEDEDTIIKRARSIVGKGAKWQNQFRHQQSITLILRILMNARTLFVLLTPYHYVI